MKIIVGGRASGKTTKLIKESAETGYRIVTSNTGAARAIYMQAKEKHVIICFIDIIKLNALNIKVLVIFYLCWNQEL